MDNSDLWLEALSIIKAIFDAIKIGTDLTDSYKKHKAEPDTIAEAERISSISTYSRDEIKSIVERLNGCMVRFIKQGDGKNRASCICSILDEVKLGNGGEIPEYDNWRNIYRQICL